MMKMLEIDKAIHFIDKHIGNCKFIHMTGRKDVSSWYAEERLYLVRKMVGFMPVYIFCVSCGQMEAEMEVIDAWEYYSKQSDVSDKSDDESNKK